jgi:TatD DNase family protein
MMKFFETHCHLDFRQFDKDRESVITRCHREGVEYFINVGIDESTSRASIKLAERYEQFYAAAGYHPHEADKFDEEKLRKLLSHSQVVALGEVGLDYYRNLSPRLVQQKAFEAQIIIAKELDLPLIIHNREADEDSMKLLRKHTPEKLVFHCYSGDLSMAEEICERGWHISFTGTVTYPNSRMDDIIRAIPSERIMIETDCPYLAPQPLRGKRNDPSTLRYVVEKISELRRVPPAIIAETVFRNSFEFFLRKNLNKN